MELFVSSAFEERLKRLASEHHVPGLSAAVIHNRQTASFAWGHRSLEPLASCTPDTIFDVASCAKSLTAAAVALLVEDEQYPEVQYNALMKDLLPGDFVMSSEDHANGVTLDDILGHRTGMAGHDDSYMGPRAAQPDTPASITRNLRNLPVAAPLRSRYLYCNMMYTVLAHLIEVKTGQSFAAVLQERVFEPLGMKSTAIQPSRAREMGLEEEIATGYYWKKQVAAYGSVQAQECPEGQGAGSVMSSANDFIKWVDALLNKKGPISEKVYAGLTRSRSIVNPTGKRLKPYSSPALYAAGMDSYHYRSRMVVGHDGHVPGFSSRFVFLPEMNFGVVVLGNSPGARALSGIIIRALMDEVLAVPEMERPLKMLDSPKAVGKAKPKKTKKQDTRMEPGQNQENATDETKGRAGEGMSGVSDEPHLRLIPDRSRLRITSSRDADGDISKDDAETLQKLQPYVGAYWHPGYHTLTVQTKGGELFVDATDRSSGFFLMLKPLKPDEEGKENWKCQAIDAVDGEVEEIDVQFELEDGKVLRMGLDLEPAVRSLIWFSRREEPPPL